MNEPREQIAIIGIGCRFPGSANSADQFWQLLRNGVDAIRDIPEHRSALMDVYDPDPTRPGRSYLRRGGFMDRIDEWDAGFFGVSPREAAHIDPQHRLLLEVAWEALEDAGQSADLLAGSRTGVFIGISTDDYGDTQCDPANRHLLDTHSNSGSATSIAANRISYLYDLRGPSFTVDTACSSSLTATHLACRSMMAGECDLAIVGGVQMQINPELTIGFCKASMISPSGECRAFDASANGYVRSEGTGVVVLKRLSAALADGDDVYAVIVGSAINQDGRTNGMTVPSASAQEAMLREALAGARLAATDLHYVEAHGTGTPVGDPLETQALGAVLREGRAEGEYCAIGSVKTNIGHLEAASGIAGLIKTALCVKHRELPASLHFTSPNPDIDFAGGRMRVVTELEPWPDALGPATAGVNSFGFGGANAHVILREAPVVAARAPEEVTVGSTATLISLSARSPEALVDLARGYMTALADVDAAPLASIASAAAHRRAHHEHRLAIVAATREEAVDALDAAIAGETRAAVARGRRAEHGGKLAFVFSGMGPQWWGMGQQLRAENRVFREMLERCHVALEPHAPWKLLDELARDEHTSRIAEPDLAQVTNFAIQVALAEVWKSWGILPEAVIGHSAGEMAAAYVGGALSLEHAVKVCYHRSRLQSAAHPGKILAVGMGAEALLKVIAEYGGEVDLAAENSPVSCTVAGGASAIEALFARLQGEQVFARMLSFAVPYHSVRMDPIEDELTSVLSNIRPVASSIPIVSTVSGTWADGTIFGANYWFQNVRRTVRFAAGIETLLDSGHTTLLEQAPHPVLAGSINEILGGRQAKAVVLASLRRKDDERAALLRTLGTLYAQGRPVNWDGVFEGRRSSVRLPSYPWQRERHWFQGITEGERNTGAGVQANPAGQHPLLGRRVRSAHPLWESSLGGDSLAFLDDHQIQGTVVFPGAAYVEMALAAARSLQTETANAPVGLRGIEFSRALFLPRRSATLVQLGVTNSGTRFEVHGSTGDGASWTLHASGEVATSVPDVRATETVADIRARCKTSVSHGDCYAALAQRGLEYGPAFRGIEQLLTGPGEAIGRIEGPALDAGGYNLHPALLDAAFQLLISAAGGTQSNGSSGGESGVFLPVQLRDLTLHAPAGGAFWAHARVVSSDGATLEGDIQLLDDGGTVVASALGFRCQRLDDARARESIDEWLYEYRWEEQPLPGRALRSSVVASPHDIAAIVQPEADALRVSLHWDDYYTKVEPRLNELAMTFIAAALRQVGGTIDGVAPGRRALGEFLLASVDARVRSAGVDADELARALAADFPDYVTDVALLVRCGTHLGDVLTGRLDAGSVLFGGDGFSQLTRFYREAPPSRFYNTLAASSVAAAVSSAGATGDRKIRVLEIGGGTGGTTAFVLPGLDAQRAEYVFTDVTAIFTEQAKETFRSVASFSARTLDIERDPLTQGFAAHSFDVILAANVLHATASLSETLAHVRQLLAPGGVLALLEITRAPIWTDLIFGITDGWWRFADRGDRPSHPLLPAHAWRALLTREGLTDVTSVADAAPLGESAQTLLLARGDEIADRFVVAPAHAQGSWLIIADSGGSGRAIAERLAVAGTDCTIVEQGDSFAQLAEGRFVMPAADRGAASLLLAALDEAGRRPRGILHCVTLDTVDAADVDPDDLLATQRAGVGSALALVQSLVALSGALPELWMVTAGAQQTVAGDRLATTQAPVWGFARVITKEHPSLRTRLVDLGVDAGASALDALAREVLAAEWEDELSLRHGVRRVRRLQRVTRGDASMAEPRRAALPGEGYRVEVGTAGALESMALRVMERRAPAANEVEIAVAAASLNFRDVMIAMGLQTSIAGEASFGRGLLGLDLAGTVTAVGDGVSHVVAGDEVVGIGAGTFGAYVTTAAPIVARRPSVLSVTQGSAVPSVFVTAYYSLRHLANLQRGERVLIHSATGGVGLAAIQVAREAGAEIYATAGSAEKRAYLASLDIAHVMDSRSLAWADDVLARTGGDGVDVVLNSLAGEAIPRGIGVLRGYGRFVEIGKRDFFQDSRIGLLAFRKNLSFFGVDVDRLSLDRPELAARMLREVLERFASGIYTPLPETVFPVSQVEGAMRFMAQAKHIGKVVLSMRDADAVVTASPARGALFRADATYLISGGLGGFGLATAAWMMSEGARHFALTGRRGAEGDAAGRVQSLREGGARVEVISADISRGGDVRRVLDAIRATMPPLRGVIHAAMVLDDSAIVDLDRARLERVMAPKMSGAWHLHRETLDDPLDCFVLLSSLTALFGNPLQANYAAANAFLDALAHERRALGRPALSINWGPLAEVGYVSRHRDVADYLDRLGYLAFSPAQAFEVLGTLLRRETTQLMAARIDWVRWSRSSQTAAASAMMRYVTPAVGADGAIGAGDAGKSGGGSLRTVLLAASSEERVARVISFLREKVAKVLGLSAAKLDDNRALTELGFDSLMAVELMTVLRVEVGVELAAVKLLQGISIAELAAQVLEQVGSAVPVAAAGDAVPPGDATVDVAVEAGVVAGVVAWGPPPNNEFTPSPVPPHHQNGAHAIIPPPAPFPLNGAAAAPAPANEPSRYATLDYSRWSTGQRAIKTAVTVAMRTLSTIHVDGLENLPRTGGCLLAINHLSMTDGPVIFSLLPRRTVMFASIHLRRSAFMHWILSDMGDAIYVRRGEGDTDALESGLAVLRAGGLLGIGPEGTRSPAGLARGHTGIAYLATQAKVPVVPLAAWGQEKIPTHLRALRRAPVHVRIGAPLYFTDAAPNAARLRDVTDQVMRAIAGLLPPEYQGVYRPG